MLLSSSIKKKSTTTKQQQKTQIKTKQINKQKKPHNTKSILIYTHTALLQHVCKMVVQVNMS